MTGEEVPYENLVKGYELTKDRYVLISPDELETLEPEKSRTIDIEDFVDLADIDPVYYDHPYYLVPDKGAAKAYGLLLNAMRESGRVAIARVILRSKEQLVAIRPDRDGSVLMMETMIFADEVVPKNDLDGLPDADELKVSDREVAMAQQLIESLSGEFEPEKYKDQYREQVLELIERKAAGEEITAVPEAPAPAKVPDLMAALEASLAAVDKPKRKRRQGTRKGQSRRCRALGHAGELEDALNGRRAATSTRLGRSRAAGARPTGPRAGRWSRGSRARAGRGRPRRRQVPRPDAPTPAPAGVAGSRVPRAEHGRGRSVDRGRK